MNQWILYYSPYLLPENNYKVDSLSTYLSGLTSKTISGGQYIRHELNLMLKINVSQAKLEKDEDFTYNYISIQNDNGEIYYYFILSKKWISSDTIALVLKMDSLNTFAIGTNYSFTDRTMILREHKNRFKKNKETHTFSGTSGNTPESTQWGDLYRMEDSYYFPDFIDCDINVSMVEPHHTYTWNRATGLLTVYIFTNNAGEEVSELTTIVAENPKRIIDFYSEGVNPVLYGMNVETIEKDYRNWYILYKGEEGQGLDCFLFSDEPFEAITVGDKTVNPNDLIAGRYYYLYSGTLIDGTIKLNAYETRYNYGTLGSLKGIKYVVEYWKDGTSIKYRRHTYHDIGLGYFHYGETPEQTTSSVKFNSIDGNKTIIYYITTSQSSALSDIEAGTRTTDILTTSSNIVYGYGDIDTTQESIAKIIKLPYCPLEYKTSGDSLVFGDGISYDGTLHLLQLEPSFKEFYSEITPVNNPLEVLNNADLSDCTSETSKSSDYESKLYHSDFYQAKYVYDSFSYIIQLEKFDITKSTYTFKIGFKQTRTPNSRFLFSFNNYICEGTYTTDYYNIMNVARNNEMPVYNSAYINYIRNGYNYDVKAKNRNEFANILGTVFKGVGTVAAFASGNPMAIAAGIGLGTSFISSVVGTVNSVASAEQNIEQKLAQLKMQSGNVVGSDDVDLMSYYADNRLKYMIYKVSEKMNKALFDLFYFTGYVANYQGIPNNTSRMWFNFVQCEANLKDVKNIPLDCLNDIIERYKAGATFMHRHNGKYDWNREYENWETVLTIPNP